MNVNKVMVCCRKASVLLLEFFAVILLLCMIAAAAFSWRLLSGPLDLSFADDVIRQAIDDNIDDYDLSYEKALMYWPSVDQPVHISLQNLAVVQDGVSLLQIPEISADLSFKQIAKAGVRPVRVHITNPSVFVVRTEDNALTLGVSAFGTQTEGDADAGELATPSPASQVDLFAELDTFLKAHAAQDGLFSMLESFEISAGEIFFQDRLKKREWSFSPVDVTALVVEDHIEVNLTHFLDQEDGREMGEKADRRIEFNWRYAYAADEMEASLFMQNFDPDLILSKSDMYKEWGGQIVSVSGTVSATIDRELMLKAADLDLSAPAGAVRIDEIYAQPLAFDKIQVVGTYDHQDKIADMEQVLLRTHNTDIILSSRIDIGDDTITAPIHVKIPRLSQDDIHALWPDIARGTGAETWLTQKLSGGYFENVQFDMQLQAAQNEDGEWDIGTDDMVASFDVHDTRVDYRAPLAPVTNAAGSGRFEGDSLKIDVNEGKVFDMAVSNGSVFLDRVVEDGGTVDISLDLSGDFQQVLQYIAAEPIAVNEDTLGMDPADIQGTSDLNIHVSFPATRELLAEQVKVVVDGTLDEARVENIVNDMDLTGGPFALSVKEGGVKLSGDGALDGQPLSFSWHQYLEADGNPYSSQVKATIDATYDVRRKLGIGLEDWVTGTVPVDLVYTTDGTGKSRVDVTGTLKGASARVDIMDYAQPVDEDGTLRAAILMKNGIIREVTDLYVQTAQLHLENGRFAFAAREGESVLKQGKIERARLQETDLAIEFEILRDESGDTLRLAANGPFLDARPFLSDKKGDGATDTVHDAALDAEKTLVAEAQEEMAGDDAPMRVIASVSAERMRTAAARMVESARIYMDMGADDDIKQFEMDAVAGTGDIYLRLKPNENGIMTLRLEADDAGETLQAFDIYNNMRGGKLVVYGEAKSVDTPRLIKGDLALSDFNVVEAPILARIVNAINPVGIQELLGGGGLVFDKLAAEFEWSRERDGDIYRVSDGKTKGPSIGLTFDGSVNKVTNKMDIAGTIVPISALNSFIGKIPLVGDILAGGKNGAILAATYKLKGPADEPEVSVNPLAALAPGILRKILFEEKPD